MKAHPRILAVDDNEINTEILTEILEDEFELRCAASGEECLDIVSQFRPHIILLDIMMPGIDGYEVCRRIRENTALRSTKVIMLSAKAMVSERVAGYEAGANDYVTKPFDKRELLAKIRIFLDLQSAEEVREARLAGMAEVATGVLHNIGNVLNSINTSAEQATTILSSTRAEGLCQVAELCISQENEFPRFVSEDARGQALPAFLTSISSQLKEERKGALKELDRLKTGVDHVKKVIQLQQAHSRGRDSRDRFEIDVLIDEALQLIDECNLRSVELEKQYGEETVVWADRNKTVQILVNLIKNSCEAVSELDSNDGRVTIQVSSPDEASLEVAVTDNGAGIRSEDLVRIFHHGYTTKQEGNGFGLHSSALAATEMNGSLIARSEGEGKGATLALRLPVNLGDSGGE